MYGSVLDVAKIHVHAKFLPAKCSTSWVIMLMDKKTVTILSTILSVKQVIWAKLVSCTRAYSSSCPQVVYLQPLQRNLCLKCVPQKNNKKSLKPPIVGDSRSAQNFVTRN